MLFVDRRCEVLEEGEQGGEVGDVFGVVAGWLVAGGGQDVVDAGGAADGEDGGGGPGLVAGD